MMKHQNDNVVINEVKRNFSSKSEDFYQGDIKGLSLSLFLSLSSMDAKNVWQ